ncbi:unnamed protein product [Adineta ricciae]|uniref:Uncharacterized protein n=1 Tax=Adineta ricciae TaxID=249248 RepID=A0A814YVP3_ADIRI|nr:unnamed protein product [Adineta ricciae]CAF1552032.1 unnamed protein product [Adineta ricciae]
MVAQSSQIRVIKRWWRLLIILLAPMVLLPLPLIIKTIQIRCAYVVLLLSIYWVSEAMPYAVTSLLPLCFFPMAGILPSDRVGTNYFKDITILFVGSMMLAQAIEHVGLHRRLALFLLSVISSSIKWIMAGLMGVTAFISMWINNSAATSIMIPAAIAIVEELQKHHSTAQQQVTNQNDEIVDTKPENISPIEVTVAFDDSCYMNAEKSEHLDTEGTITIDMNNQVVVDNTQKRYQQLKTGFLIAVAYSAAIGGLATLVGTGPNIFIKGFTDEFYSKGQHAFEITFTNFLLFALPTGIIMLLCCWLWLQLLYNRQELLFWLKKDRKAIESQHHLRSVLKKQYEELGSFNWREYIITILFVSMVALWVTRDFSSYSGWKVIFRKDYVTDGTIALLIGTLPLILPDKNPFHKDWQYHPILRWEQICKTFPWGVFMLQGAGLAIADGFKASDLSSMLASFLQFVVGASDITVIFVTILISAIFTEFTSNLTCASILFPILDSVANTAKIHAARLILPSCMAVSLSFMLPIATPPNAMIFSSGNVRMIDLIKVGFGMKVIGIMIILFSSTILLSPIFHIQSLISNLNETSLFNDTTRQ